MIKRIPIKGISRDPSGQIAADGMCADSLNVQLDMGEVAPAITPREANSRFEKETDGAVLPINKVSGSPLYIHKGEGYENLISFVSYPYTPRPGVTITMYVLYSYSAEFGRQTVLGPYADMVIKDIMAVGNTLVVSLEDSLAYILWKGGEYIYLGDKIPTPDISFRMGDIDGDNLRSSMEPLTVEEAVEQGGWEPLPTEETEMIALSGDEPTFKHTQTGDITEFGSPTRKYSFKEDIYWEFWSGIFNQIWNGIDFRVKEALDDGILYFPIFARFAVRLYDGSLYAQSIPILVGADIQYPMATIGVILQLFVNDQDAAWKNSSFNFVKFTSGYKLFLKSSIANSHIYDNWEDIVTGIDIFLSPQIMPLQRDAAKFEVEYLGSTEIGGRATSRLYAINNFHIDPFYMDDNQEELIRQYQDTYLAKSYTLQEFNNLAGVEVRIDDVNYSADWLMNQEALKESPGSMHTVCGGSLYKYNNKLLVAAPELRLYPGYEYFHSSIWRQETPTTDFSMYFFIHGDNGDFVVTKFVQHRSEAIIHDVATPYNEFLGPWIAYPDSRCYKVMLVRTYTSNSQTYYTHATYTMKALSEIDVSFAFLGFGNVVETSAASTVNPSPTVRDVWPHKDALFAADVNNPFMFTTDKVIRFSNGSIMAVGAVTIPLSEGQKGQFPLYVFTDEGVFALSVNSLGEFMTSDSISRDVILSKNSLTAIEQGIFFASARGLLLLQGNSITKVSDLMDGPVDEMDSTLSETIGSLYFGDFDVPDADTFVTYLHGCRMAYDYVAKRIIVFNPDKDYAYVYKIDTQSWHRVCFGPKLINALNSYPEALICTLETGETNQAIYDFSVPAESEGAVALPGIVYTRELLLDDADLYKAISHLKIRGRYQDGHVKWQLQGSNDGVNYVNLHSLRGPSWKWYRMAVVTLLDPTERISYIELDYQPKFTNKIR